MSWVRPALNTWLRWTEKPHMARARTPSVLRRSFEAKARLFFHAPRGSRIEKSTCGGRPALRITHQGRTDGALLLYFHGGAYIFGSPKTHSAMLAYLCKAAGAHAVLPDYRKAPENPHPAALEDAMAAFLDVQQANPDARIFLGGDSAGGGLALALLAKLIANQQTLPSGVFAFSPLTDMTYSGASVQENAASDVVLPVSQIPTLQEMYLAGQDAMAPGASPLFADFTGAPPVFLAVGDTEILRDDSVRLKSVLEAKGVEVTFGMARDLPHVWPIFHNILPEARATLRVVADWIRQQSPS